MPRVELASASPLEGERGQLIEIPRMTAHVKVFGRRPARTLQHALRPASENLQGTKPRERARIGRCRALSYGDLAVGGPLLRSTARSAERWGWRCSSGARRFSDLRAGAWHQSCN